MAAARAARAALAAGLACVAFATLAPGAEAQLSPAELRDSSRAALERDVRHLAGPDLGGRATGSEGNRLAAEFIARSFLSAQVDAVLDASRCDSAGRCPRTYFLGFRVPAPLLREIGADTTTIAYDIVGAVRGTDSLLAQEWIVVGAHYDHLGTTGFGVRDVRTRSAPHYGADDNASGTAAVLELARRLSADPPRRSVLFVLFGAEEIGLLGSQAFVRSETLAPASIAAMVNLDMVGTLEHEGLDLYGVGTSRGWRAAIAAARAAQPLSVELHDAVHPREGGSDHMSFAAVGIPAIHLFTGTHPAYHTKDDVPNRLDFDGLRRVTWFADALVRALANADARLVPSAPR